MTSTRALICPGTEMQRGSVSVPKTDEAVAADKAYADAFSNRFYIPLNFEKGKRKVQRVPQSQTAALPRLQEEEETDKCKQAQIEQTYEKH